MEKPLNLQTEEAKERILNTINESRLPAFIMELIIKDIYNEIVFIKNAELQNSKTQYQKALQESKTVENAETVENTEK